MQTEFIKLAVIFIVIMVMVLAKLKLRDAMIVAILLTVILFGIPLGDAAKLMIQSVYEKDTLLVVGSFILVTFLQRIMENRKLLESMFFRRHHCKHKPKTGILYRFRQSYNKSGI